MKMKWIEVDEIASRHGARRVMQTGPLGRDGFSFAPNEIFWLDLRSMTADDFDRELSRRLNVH